MPVRILRIFTAFLIIVSFFPAAAHAMKMNIDPARVEVTMKPGEDTTGSIIVLNYDEEKPVRVKAYIQDLVYLPDGSNDFLKLGSTPWSLNDWIRIGPTEFDIPPGKQETVRYMISMPKGATGGRYGMIFFETVPAPSEIKRVGASINFRLGSVVLVTAEGTAAVNAKLKGLSVKPPEKGGPVEISWTVYNDSNILVRPIGSVKIIDAGKKEVATIDANKLKEGVFPKTARTFSSQYKETLPKGLYHVQIVLDYGGEALLGGQSKLAVN